MSKISEHQKAAPQFQSLFSMKFFQTFTFFQSLFILPVLKMFGSRYIKVEVPELFTTKFFQTIDDKIVSIYVLV